MPDLQPGDPRRLGSYELTGRLGEGGQGVVYLGTDPTGSQVAVKLLRADLTLDESARSRFVREVESTKAVKQFCTAQVLEADVAGDRPYIVSEYIRGPSLHRQVTTEGPYSGPALERLAIGTVTALVAIHKAGIIHRDFKPHNVLIGPDGPRVIDFGIAKALDVTSTASTQAVGTPAYMAPEQVMGATLTPKVDIFSWALVMVYAATGRAAFGQDTIPAVINRILNQEPDLTGIPADMLPLLTACLAKEPERRPDASQVLMRLLGQEGAPADAAATAVLAQPSAADTTPTRADRIVDDATLRGAAFAAGGAAGAAGAGRTAVWGGGPPPGGTVPYGTGQANLGGPGDRTRNVALIAAIGAVVLVIVVGAAIWGLTSNSSSGGGNNTGTSDSPSGSPTVSTSATADTSAPTDTQPAQPAPRHTHTSAPPTYTPTPTPTVTDTPTTGGGSTVPSSPPASTGTGGGGTGAGGGATPGATSGG